MKISKIFAGMSALAMMATLSISASASTTIACDDPDPLDCADASWGSIWADGKYAAAESFSDGEVTVTVNFEWTDLAKDEEYCAFKPAFANGWEGIYKAHPEYVSGFVCAKEDATQDEETGKYLTADGTILDWAPQKDGFFQVYNTDVTSVTFTLSADCVADMKDYSTYYGQGKATKNDDGTTTDWDGFLIQKGNNGIAITSVEFSQDGVKLNTELEEGGDDAGDGDADSDAGDADSDAGDADTDDGDADADSDAGDADTDDGDADADDGDADADDGDADADDGDADADDGDADADDGDAGDTAGSGDSNNGGNAGTGNGSVGNTSTGNTTTGASAGLALAGLALAGAAVVVSKKR